MKSLGARKADREHRDDEEKGKVQTITDEGTVFVRDDKLHDMLKASAQADVNVANEEAERRNVSEREGVLSALSKKSPSKADKQDKSATDDAGSKQSLEATEIKKQGAQPGSAVESEPAGAKGGNGGAAAKSSPAWTPNKK